MKHFHLLIWLTQLGISVAGPLVCCIWLAVWLRDRFGLGSWVAVVGVLAGICCAVNGLRISLKAMSLMAKDKKGDPPPAAFNDHE